MSYFSIRDMAPSLRELSRKASIVGIGAKLSRSTETIDEMVLISDTASAPPFLAARAG